MRNIEITLLSVRSLYFVANHLFIPMLMKLKSRYGFMRLYNSFINALGVHENYDSRDNIAIYIW
jgi:hypothetical protein